MRREQSLATLEALKQKTQLAREHACREKDASLLVSDITSGYEMLCRTSKSAYIALLLYGGRKRREGVDNIEDEVGSRNSECGDVRGKESKAMRAVGTKG